MARIIVVPDGQGTDKAVLDERHVVSEHLRGEGGSQLLERLEWAIQDAQRRLGRSERGRRPRHAGDPAHIGPFE
jgi:hypothetical protein